MKNNEQEQQIPKLYMVVAEDTKTGIRRNIAVYRTVKDAEVICEANEKNSFPEGMGVELNKNEVLGIEPVERENTFGLTMPSWEEDMKRIQEQLEGLVSTIKEDDEQKEVSEKPDE